ncbi:LysR family transcriptional regulator [Agrobacterium tumefaciens]|uniref:LysR substrate-binding domain-containing protein n=1 Tax=Agrobacterium tumefaciens TaxID=358 RepID=UPI00080FDA9D|nr:LysR family transcriptional regulator [Agrobacterium tumefaciens]
MDLGRLRTLRELSIRKTMAAVSEALYVSPSAISQQLTLLEQEVGAALIERRGRGVALTAAGQVLVEHAERVFAELETAKADIQRLENLVAGDIRIAAFPSVAAAIMPSAIRDLKRQHPLLNIGFDEMEPEESLSALRTWQTDIAIIDDLNVLAGALDPGIETVPLAEDVFLVMMGREHPLAEKPDVTLNELRDESWVIDTASSNYTSMITQACQGSGFDPRIVARCKGFEVSVALIREHCGISILPGLRASRDLRDVEVRPLKPEIRRRISLAFRKGQGHSPLIRAVARACHQRAAELLPSKGS